MTRGGDHYEPGAFDVRDGALRRTPLADCIAQLAGPARPRHAESPTAAGWWHEPARLIHGTAMPVGHNA